MKRRVKRWWGVRHLRYWWHEYRALKWAGMWGHAGVGLAKIDPIDAEYLAAIWKGQA